MIYQDRIIITSKNLYWFYVAVSLPLMDEDEFIRYVKNSGRQDYYEITLIFVEKWTMEKYQEAKIHNQAIWEELDKLPEKYGVAHLSPNKMGSFFPDSEEDKEKIKKYDQEYKVLMAQLIEIPSHHSTNYSIFFRDNTIGFEWIWSEEELINSKLKKIFNKGNF